MNNLLIIDGNALMHRAYHALPPFRTSYGVPTNATYGFFSMLHKTIDLFKPSHLSICFDRPEPTFRKKMYVEYQIHRPKTDDDLIEQFPITKELLDHAKLKRFEKAGIEADDIIGTIANKTPNNTKIYILTGDKDLLQLVNERTFIITPLKGISDLNIYDANKIKERFSVNPEQIPDLKALMGDSSDNYKGVKGIGPKTASELLSLYESIENVYKNIDEITNKNIRNALINDKEHAFLSKDLATIRINENIDYNFDESIFNGFNEELKKEFEKYEFTSLSKRYFPQKKEQKNKIKKQEDNNQQALF